MSSGSLPVSATRAVAAVVLGSWVLLAALSPWLGAGDRPTAGRIDRASVSLLPPMTNGLMVQTPADRIRFVPSGTSPRAGEEVVGSERFWLGTDRIGRDLGIEFVRGAATSLLVGCLAAALAVTLGVGYGALAGLAPARADDFLMRLVDAALAFPLLLLVLLLDLLFDPGLWALIALLGAVQWMGMARIVRAETQRLRSAPFALAARATGVRALPLFLRHLLPNAARPIVVAGLLLVGDSILLESTVSFLGFGAAGDLHSWGRLVDDGRPFLRDAWWISTLPGLAIMLVVAAVNVVGEPRSRVRAASRPGRFRWTSATVGSGR